MKKLLKFFLVIVGALLGPAAFAAEYTDFSSTGPFPDAAQALGGLEVMTENMTLFFGVVVVLAILVTGFFLGRKWLRSVG